MTLDPEFLLPADAMETPFDDDAFAALIAYFENNDPDTEAPDRPSTERFRIEDDSAAEWAMRKLAAATARAQEIDAAAQQHHEEIDRWVDRRMRPARREVEFFEAILVDYGIRQVEEAKRKTVDVPSGKIRSLDRRETPKIVVTNPADLAAWAGTTLSGDDASEVVPPQDPKVLVSKLADHVEVVLARDADDRIVGARIIDENGVEVPGVAVEYGDLTTKAVPR